MIHYHPFRFAYALTGISAFLYYYLPAVNVDGVVINHYEMLTLFLLWVLYELAWQLHEDADVILLYPFALLSYPAFYLLSVQVALGWVLLGLYLLIGVLINIAHKLV